jgi:hypothetical protein
LTPWFEIINLSCTHFAFNPLERFVAVKLPDVPLAIRLIVAIRLTFAIRLTIDLSFRSDEHTQIFPIKMKLSPVSILLAFGFVVATAITDISGVYEGIDIDDGSRQLLTVRCTSSACDFILTDTSFTSCKNANGTITNGFATKAGVTNLASFNFDLFCSDVLGENVIKTPKTTLKGDLDTSKTGYLKRIVPGYLYVREGNVEIPPPKKGLFGLFG